MGMCACLLLVTGVNICVSLVVGADLLVLWCVARLRLSGNFHNVGVSGGLDVCLIGRYCCIM